MQPNNACKLYVSLALGFTMRLKQQNILANFKGFSLHILQLDASLVLVKDLTTRIVDILQDCRYWVIHVITIPALFLSGVVCVASGILFNVAGTANWLDYFSFVTSLSLLNDRCVKHITWHLCIAVVLYSCSIVQFFSSRIEQFSLPKQP